jgi:hypothetical protein
VQVEGEGVVDRRVIRTPGLTTDERNDNEQSGDR